MNNTSFEREVIGVLNNLVEDINIKKKIAIDRGKNSEGSDEHYFEKGYETACADIFNLVDQTIHGIGLIKAIHKAKSDRDSK